MKADRARKTSRKEAHLMSYKQLARTGLALACASLFTLACATTPRAGDNGGVTLETAHIAPAAMESRDYYVVAHKKQEIGEYYIEEKKIEDTSFRRIEERFTLLVNGMTLYVSIIAFVDEREPSRLLRVIASQKSEYPPEVYQSPFYARRLGDTPFLVSNDVVFNYKERLIFPDYLVVLFNGRKERQTNVRGLPKHFHGDIGNMLLHALPSRMKDGDSFSYAGYNYFANRVERRRIAFLHAARYNGRDVYVCQRYLEAKESGVFYLENENGLGRPLYITVPFQPFGTLEMYIPEI